MRQLHLQFSGPGSGPLGKNIQDHLAAIHHPHPHRLFQGAHLAVGEFPVEHHQVSAQILDQQRQLLHLTGADYRGRVGSLPPLPEGLQHLTAGAFHQAAQLRQPIHEILVALPGLLQPHQDGPILIQIHLAGGHLAPKAIF
ncbi:hypothetical protein SYN63AY4M2_13405 [Synechococcus sp. 63AY4M2]|nr:hypothetical protein SYN63AY4M2_13405 [Synechococcus sp. 63AY4M2]